jgi:hypothetical protein
MAVPVAEGEGAPSTGAALPAIAAATIAPEVDVAPALETATTASIARFCARWVRRCSRSRRASAQHVGRGRHGRASPARPSPPRTWRHGTGPGTRPSIAAVAEAAITETEITSAARPRSMWPR